MRDLRGSRDCGCDFYSCGCLDHSTNAGRSLDSNAVVDIEYRRVLNKGVDLYLIVDNLCTDIDIRCSKTWQTHIVRALSW